ncbi:hypothetical protein FACS1894132_13940 [Clostridia bacterium]|nr:hypothetical protein FACS1894132_13940 [Clostridia bacterium]
MNNFYIRSITASGADKLDATVKFTDGLNIICGVSDTGKSCVLLCIDFIFDSRTAPFSKKKTGYTEVSMQVETEYGMGGSRANSVRTSSARTSAFHPAITTENPMTIRPAALSVRHF